MKNRIVNITLPMLLPVLALDAVDQETEEYVRMEYLLCQLNEGSTFDDVIAQAKEYGEKVAAEGNHSIYSSPFP